MVIDEISTFVLVSMWFVFFPNLSKHMRNTSSIIARHTTTTFHIHKFTYSSSNCKAYRNNNSIFTLPHLLCLCIIVFVKWHIGVERLGCPSYFLNPKVPWPMLLIISYPLGWEYFWNMGKKMKRSSAILTWRKRSQKSCKELTEPNNWIQIFRDLFGPWRDQKLSQRSTWKRNIHPHCHCCYKHYIKKLLNLPHWSYVIKTTIMA